MSRKFKIRDNSEIYFVTFTVINWIDIFIRDEYRNVLIDSIKFCQKNKGLEVYAYCIMTSHVHLIISSDGTTELAGIVRDLKSYTSRQIRLLLEDENFPESRRKWLLYMFKNAGIRNTNNIDFQLWQQHYHPIVLDNNFLMEQKLNYIHQNPIEAGFVFSPEEWVYSSAADYAGTNKGAIELIYIQ